MSETTRPPEFETSPDRSETNVTNIETRKLEKILQTGRTTGVAISGKMGSGKDTVASALVNILPPDLNVEIFKFSSVMRQEVTDVIATITGMGSATPRQHIVAHLAEKYDITEPQATKTLTLVETLLRTVGPDVTGWTRSEHTRQLLQYWPTEIRRDTNPNYWSTLAQQEISALITQNKLVVITDLREPVELALVESLNIATVRLQIDTATQKTRIKQRDGFIPDDKTLTHKNETLLDHKEFDLTINTATTNPEEAAELIRDHLTQLDAA